MQTVEVKQHKTKSTSDGSGESSEAKERNEHVGEGQFNCNRDAGTQMHTLSSLPSASMLHVKTGSGMEMPASECALRSLDALLLTSVLPEMVCFSPTSAAMFPARTCGHAQEKGGRRGGEGEEKEWCVAASESALVSVEHETKAVPAMGWWLH